MTTSPMRRAARQSATTSKALSIHNVNVAFEWALKMYGYYDADAYSRRFSCRLQQEQQQQQQQSATDTRDAKTTTPKKKTKKKKKKKVDGGSGIDALDHIVLDYAVQWPVSLIVSRAELGKYQRIHGFFMRVKRVTFELNALWITFQQHRLSSVALVRRRTAKQRAALAAMDAADESRVRARALLVQQVRTLQLARREMQHLIDIVQGYLITQVLEISWTEFQAALRRATTLEAVRSAHSAYLDSALHRCFLSVQTRAILRIFTPVFAHILQFKALVSAALQRSRRAAQQRQQRQQHSVGDDDDDEDDADIDAAAAAAAADADLQDVDMEPITAVEFRALQGVIAQFHNYTHFLYDVLYRLSDKGVAGIADLVIRLDFNRYYARSSAESSSSAASAAEKKKM
jgi:hypothetical protein